jgi:hypothetical protein
MSLLGEELSIMMKLLNSRESIGTNDGVCELFSSLSFLSLQDGLFEIVSIT